MREKPHTVLRNPHTKEQFLLALGVVDVFKIDFSWQYMQLFAQETRKRLYQKDEQDGARLSMGKNYDKQT